MKIEDDDILSELINEIDNNESSATANRTTSASVLSEKQLSREYMKSFSVPKRPQLPKSLTTKENTISNVEQLIKPTQKLREVKDVALEEGNEGVVEKTQREEEIRDEVPATCSESVFDDDLDMTQVEEFEPVREAIAEEDLLKGWETMQKGIENQVQTSVVVDSKNLPVTENEEGKKVKHLLGIAKWLLDSLVHFL